MTKELVNTSGLEKIMMENDLASLSAQDRIKYVKATCDSLGINFLTRPFDFIRFQGKTILYANKGCAEQLRQNYNISCKVTGREIIDGVFIVTVEASNGIKSDSSIGCVAVTGLKGEALANAMMKAETKAKRRVTLSICSMNMLDESEVETIREAIRYNMTSEGELIANQDDLKRVEQKAHVETLVKETEEKASLPENQNHALKMKIKKDMDSLRIASNKLDNLHTWNNFKAVNNITSLEVLEKMNEEQLKTVEKSLENHMIGLNKKVQLESDLGA